MPRKHKTPRDPLAGLDLLTVLRRYPKTLKVLHKHGVHFCSGCYLTLSARLEKVAAYHAVTDVRTFLADLRRAARRG